MIPSRAVLGLHRTDSREDGSRANPSQRIERGDVGHVPASAGSIRSRACFSVNCTACGRSLRAPVQLLGRQVCCHHCGKEFTASDPAADLGSDMPANLRRADELLRRVDSYR